MQLAIQRIQGYCANAPTLDAFREAAVVQDAVIRNLEILGEAANRVRRADPDFESRHPQIPWAAVAGMRNRLIHEYFEVDLEVVWQTVRHELPTLSTVLADLVDELEQRGDDASPQSTQRDA